MDLNKIGVFIANCRKEKNLTQEKLSELICVSNSTVSKWERGINMPDISILNRLGKELDVSVIELLNGEKNTYDDISIEAIKYYNKRVKNRIILILIIIILMALFIFISIIAFTNYKKYKLFEISSINNNLKVSGWLIYNPYRKIMVIKDFEYFDNNIGTDDEIKSNFYKIKLYTNNKIINNQTYEFEEKESLNNFLKGYMLYVDDIVKNNEYLININNVIFVIEYENNDEINNLEFKLEVKEMR